MRPTIRSEALPLALVAATWLIYAWHAPHLPDPVPTHWGLNGMPDAWAPRSWGSMIGPLVATVTYLLMRVIPWIDPRQGHWAGFASSYHMLRLSLLAFFLGLTHLTLAASTRPGQALQLTWLMAAMGLLLVLLGNYLPKLRSNYFVGVRNPWTLASDEVWERTHRLAGRGMVVAGALVMLAGQLPPAAAFGAVVGVMLAFTGAVTLYSYLLFRRLARPEA